MNDFPEPDSIHEAMGTAIEAYARVEAHQARLIELLLNINSRQAHAIFFAIPNVRSRNELIQTLLSIHFTDKLKKHWASCAAFLEKLSKFRNAIVHWHPMFVIYVSSKNKSKPTGSELGLSHPVPGRTYATLRTRDFPAFLADCSYIGAILSELNSLVRSEQQPLPDIFQKPISRQNQAVLRQRQTPKEQQPQRLPSVPKLSRAQKRAKALKDARLAAKKT